MKMKLSCLPCFKVGMEHPHYVLPLIITMIHLDFIQKSLVITPDNFISIPILCLNFGMLTLFLNRNKEMQGPIN